MNVCNPGKSRRKTGRQGKRGGGRETVSEGGSEGGRERERGRERGGERGGEGGRQAGKQAGREGEREEGREGERERGREGERGGELLRGDTLKRRLWHSYVWHDSFICVTRLVHICDITHSYFWYDLFIFCTSIFIFWTYFTKAPLSHVLHRVALRCSVLQFVAVWCSVLQCVAVYILDILSKGASVTHRHARHHPYKCDMSHMKESSHTESVTDIRMGPRGYSAKRSYVHLYVWHVSLIWMGRHISICDMTHSYVWHDSFICVTWLIHIWHMCHKHTNGPSWVCCGKRRRLYSYGVARISRLLKIIGLFCRISSLLYGTFAKETNNVKEPTNHSHPICVFDTFPCVIWRIHMCDMTHSHVWHDSFICVTWLVHMCGMTHSYVWHDSNIWMDHHRYALTRRHVYSYVWHDSVICVTWHIHMCDMTHLHV